MTANVAPRLCAEFQAACLAGRWADALALQDRLYPLHAALFSDASPGPAKYALSKVRPSFPDELRLPMTPAERSEPSRGRCRADDRRAALMARPRPVEFEKTKIVAENRRARYEYFLEQFFEAGIALTGTEVKSLRFGEGSIAESYAEVKDGQVSLINANIPEFSHGNRFNHEPKRPRKLLLHEREIEKLRNGVSPRGHDADPARRSISTRAAGPRSNWRSPRARSSTTSARRVKERDWKREQARLHARSGLTHERPVLLQGSAEVICIPRYTINEGCPNAFADDRAAGFNHARWGGGCRRNPPPFSTPSRPVRRLRWPASRPTARSVSTPRAWTAR